MIYKRATLHALLAPEKIADVTSGQGFACCLNVCKRLDVRLHELSSVRRVAVLNVALTAARHATVIQQQYSTKCLADLGTKQPDDPVPSVIHSTERNSVGLYCSICFINHIKASGTKTAYSCHFYLSRDQSLAFRGPLMVSLGPMLQPTLVTPATALATKPCLHLLRSYTGCPQKLAPRVFYHYFHNH